MKTVVKDLFRKQDEFGGKEITVSLLTSLLSMIGAILVGVGLIQKTIAGTITVSEFYLLITAIMTLATN